MSHALPPVGGPSPSEDEFDLDSLSAENLQDKRAQKMGAIPGTPLDPADKETAAKVDGMMKDSAAIAVMSASTSAPPTLQQVQASHAVIEQLRKQLGVPADATLYSGYLQHSDEELFQNGSTDLDVRTKRDEDNDTSRTVIVAQYGNRTVVTYSHEVQQRRRRMLGNKHNAPLNVRFNGRHIPGALAGHFLSNKQLVLFVKALAVNDLWMATYAKDAAKAKAEAPKPKTDEAGVPLSNKAMDPQNAKDQFKALIDKAAKILSSRTNDFLRMSLALAAREKRFQEESKQAKVAQERDAKAKQIIADARKSDDLKRAAEREVLHTAVIQNQGTGHVFTVKTIRTANGERTIEGTSNRALHIFSENPHKVNRDQERLAG